jgi:GTP-binding protein EngB required for normal cell division
MAFTLTPKPQCNTGTKSGLSTALRLEDGVELLDTIDKLRGLGIAEEIPLPQIVVVGQQSSGKSSVLEAISGIPFPTNDGLCTRFATEVVLRRASKATTNVQIVRESYTGLGEDPYQKSIKKFHSDVRAMSPLGTENVPDLVAMAAKCLSLDSSKNFTKDYLRIEVSGPTQDHLTLVDLPGLFYYTKAGQDSTEPEIVKDLAKKYMSERRSIILTVLSAKTDYSTQEILQTLKGIDRTGSRTMGVITGVDQVERHSARETDYLALADNDITPLALGWHVLRNPSFTDRQSATLNRDELEKQFFESHQPWSTISAECRGAEKLKLKLSHILMEHIGRELKDVIASLNQKIEVCEKALSKCGVERTTQQQKRIYLSKIGTEYRTLVKAALEGPYEDAFFSLTGERLRAKVRRMSEQFAHDMSSCGSRWMILTPGELRDDPKGSDASKSRRIGDRSSKDELETSSHSLTKDEYLEKVSEVLREHRGRELQGTFNPLLIGVLFRDQSCRWRKLAENHVRQVATLLSKFIQKITEHLTDSERTRILIGERLRSALLARENLMGTRLEEILKPFEKSYPTTYNPLMRTALFCRQAEEEEEGEEVEEEEEEDPQVLSPDQDVPACQSLMGKMQCYYNIALHTFVDNVATLGVELCLLDGLEDLFSPVAVSEMSDEQVSKLASESPDDILQRRTTEKRLEKLKAGREVCQRYNLPELAVTAPEIVTETAIVQQSKPSFTFSSPRPTTPSQQSRQSSREKSPMLSHSPGASVSSASSKMSTSASKTATTPGLTGQKPVASPTPSTSNLFGAPGAFNFGNKAVSESDSGTTTGLTGQKPVASPTPSTNNPFGASGASTFGNKPVFGSDSGTKSTGNIAVSPASGFPPPASRPSSTLFGSSGISHESKSSSSRGDRSWSFGAFGVSSSGAFESGTSSGFGAGSTPSGRGSFGGAAFGKSS